MCCAPKIISTSDSVTRHVGDIWSVATQNYPQLFRCVELTSNLCRISAVTEDNLPGLRRTFDPKSKLE